MIAARNPDANPPPVIPDKLCEAHGCQTEVSSCHVMCPHHWQMVPYWLRRQIDYARESRRWKEHRRRCISAASIVQQNEKRQAKRRVAR